MGVLSWIVFGLIVGFLANLIDPSPSQGGLIGTLLLGVLGSLVGGFLGSLIFGVGVSGFNVSSFIIAVLGSLLLLILQRSFRRAM